MERINQALASSEQLIEKIIENQTLSEGQSISSIKMLNEEIMKLKTSIINAR